MKRLILFIFPLFFGAGVAGPKSSAKPVPDTSVLSDNERAYIEYLAAKVVRQAFKEPVLEELDSLKREVCQRPERRLRWVDTFRSPDGARHTWYWYELYVKGEKVDQFVHKTKR